MSELALDNLSPVSTITYDVQLDAINVILLGNMWGLHRNGSEILFTF